MASPRKLSHLTKEETIDFVNKAEAIFQRQLKDVQSLTKDISEKYPKYDQNKFSSRSLSKTLLHINTQLTGQCIKSIKSGCLLIACIGGRSLLEAEINTKYIFRHPAHKDDPAWVDELSRSYWNITRIKKRHKASLGGVSVSFRAKEVRKATVYRNEYTHLTSLTHGLAQGVGLNDADRFHNTSAWLAIICLVNLNNIIFYISKWHNLGRDRSIEKQIKELTQSYNDRLKAPRKQ